MGRTVSIGAQGFSVLREQGAFYVDKTGFLMEWWDSLDVVTLVCRPRRFGKTLNLSMAECFLSTEYAGRGEELFGDLSIWQHERFRALQGTVPVIALSFAGVKERRLKGAIAAIKRVLRVAVRKHDYLRDSPAITPDEVAFLERVCDDMPDDVAIDSLNQLCAMLRKHHGTRPVVLLDEYDTPMQEAWLGGYWDGMASFVRSLFNSTLKTNPSLGRALVTGVTRVSRESVFSDLNNLEVVTTTSPKFQAAFGFTEAEVLDALDEMGYGQDAREGVRDWYDGFSFGRLEHVYNPWSVTNFLDKGAFAAYWANTSGNELVSRIVRTGGGALQSDFEELIAGRTVTKSFEEQVAFDDLGLRGDAAWPLLLAAGYLKAVDFAVLGKTTATLAVTNREVAQMFSDMVVGWFDDGTRAYSGFVRSLLAGDLEAAEDFLRDVLEACVSSFDGGAAGGGASAPENFYHGLVLGLLVELRGRYEVTSNRESGRGRYDVVLFPLRDADPALVLEFKVLNRRRERDLAEALAAAKAQIAERRYARTLVERGIDPERVLEVGVAFDGKDVMVG